jgi:hypothetical protein
MTPACSLEGSLKNTMPSWTRSWNFVLGDRIGGVGDDLRSLEVNDPDPPGGVVGDEDPAASLDRSAQVCAGTGERDGVPARRHGQCADDDNPIGCDEVDPCGGG